MKLKNILTLFLMIFFLLGLANLASAKITNAQLCEVLDGDWTVGKVIRISCRVTSDSAGDHFLEAGLTRPSFQSVPNIPTISKNSCHPNEIWYANAWVYLHKGLNDIYFKVVPVSCDYQYSNGKDCGDGNWVAHVSEIYGTKKGNCIDVTGVNTFWKSEYFPVGRGEHIRVKRCINTDFFDEFPEMDKPRTRDFMGDLIWYDLTNPSDSEIIPCAYGCENGICNPAPQYIIRYEKKCKANSLYWYDNKGNPSEFIEMCEFGCENGACKGVIPPVCGNYICEPGETPTSCPTDCKAPPVCGNGICESGETAATCPADCGGEVEWGIIAAITAGIIAFFAFIVWISRRRT